jgi:glycosyltransferase involved in cell wall biosynthesis
LKHPPKTIALVANTSWNLVHFRYSLAERFQERGFRVLAIAPPGPYSQKLHTFPFSRYYPWTRLKAHGRNALEEWLAMRELRQLYKTLAPDLALHFTIKPNLYGSWAARRLGIPSISTITGLGYPFLHPEGSSRAVPYLYRNALRGSSAVVFQNEDDHALFLRRKLVDPGKARLIRGSGVDTRFFKPQKGASASDRPFTFFFAGRLLRDKGILEYLEAGRRLAEFYPGINCWIAGEQEPENPAALSQAQLEPYFSHPAFRYWGFQEDIRLLMANADVFVLPSYREGIPRAVLEAMAMGKPVITTEAAGCKETVVHGENGFLAPVGNVQALFEAMIEMMEMEKPILHKMGEKSRERAIAQFDIQAINQQFLDLAEQLLAHGISARTRSIVL